MKAKRLVLVALVVFVVALLAGSVSAAEYKIGHLSRLNMSPDEMKAKAQGHVNTGKSMLFFAAGKPSTTKPLFYDSLQSMLMALNAGEIDVMSLPESVAEYVMNVNDGFEVAGILRMMTAYLSLGFRKDYDPTTLHRFNEAILSMKADGTLAILRAKYIDEAGLDEPEAVKFEKFENAGSVKVAVTGDMPPIDYIAADGTPAGFNTAVLAEIAKRMKVNIELLNIDSGARAAALASKRADVVFWFRTDTGVDVQADVPEDIALSEAYYSWNENLHIKKK